MALTGPSKRGHGSKVYRRKRPFNKGDQPLNESDDGSGLLQHAFQPVNDEKGFDFSQTPDDGKLERRSVNTSSPPTSVVETPKKVPTVHIGELYRPTAHKTSEKNRVAIGDDSDICDFNE